MSASTIFFRSRDDGGGEEVGLEAGASDDDGGRGEGGRLLTTREELEEKVAVVLRSARQGEPAGTCTAPTVKEQPGSEQLEAYEKFCETAASAMQKALVATKKDQQGEDDGSSCNSALHVIMHSSGVASPVAVALDKKCGAAAAAAGASAVEKCAPATPAAAHPAEEEPRITMERSNGAVYWDVGESMVHRSEPDGSCLYNSVAYFIDGAMPRELRKRAVENAKKRVEQNRSLSHTNVLVRGEAVQHELTTRAWLEDQARAGTHAGIPMLTSLAEMLESAVFVWERQLLGTTECKLIAVYNYPPPNDAASIINLLFTPGEGNTSHYDAIPDIPPQKYKEVVEFLRTRAESYTDQERLRMCLRWGKEGKRIEEMLKTTMVELPKRPVPIVNSSKHACYQIAVFQLLAWCFRDQEVSDATSGHRRCSNDCHVGERTCQALLNLLSFIRDDPAGGETKKYLWESTPLAASEMRFVWTFFHGGGFVWDTSHDAVEFFNHCHLLLTAHAGYKNVGRDARVTFVPNAGVKEKTPCYKVSEMLVACGEGNYHGAERIIVDFPRYPSDNTRQKKALFTIALDDVGDNGNDLVVPLGSINYSITGALFYKPQHFWTWIRGTVTWWKCDDDSVTQAMMDLSDLREEIESSSVMLVLQRRGDSRPAAAAAAAAGEGGGGSRDKGWMEGTMTGGGGDAAAAARPTCGVIAVDKDRRRRALSHLETRQVRTTLKRSPINIIARLRCIFGVVLPGILLQAGYIDGLTAARLGTWDIDFSGKAKKETSKDKIDMRKAGGMHSLVRSTNTRTTTTT